MIPLTFFGIPDGSFICPSKAWLTFGQFVDRSTTEMTAELVVSVMEVVKEVHGAGSGCDGLMTIFSSCVRCGGNDNDGDNEADGNGGGWP